MFPTTQMHSDVLWWLYIYWKYSLKHIKYGQFKLGLPHIFLELMRILQHHYSFGFLGTYQSLPYRMLRQTVRGAFLFPSRKEAPSKPFKMRRGHVSSVGKNRNLVLKNPTSYSHLIENITSKILSIYSRIILQTRGQWPFWSAVLRTMINYRNSGHIWLQIWTRQYKREKKSLAWKGDQTLDLWLHSPAP